MNNNIIEDSKINDPPIKKKRGRPKKTIPIEVNKPDCIVEVNKSDCIVEKKSRGRPSKKKIDIVEDDNKVVRKRGRPKKNVEEKELNDSTKILEEEIICNDSKKIEEHDRIYNEKQEKELNKVLSDNDLFEDCGNNSNLELHINELSDDSKSNCSLIENDNNDNTDYEEITCELIKYNGKDYLKDSCTNNIYSCDNENNFVGKYNPLTSTIDFTAFD